MAGSGEDARLTHMLLELAAEMDAEADAIDAALKLLVKQPHKNGIAA